MVVNKGINTNGGVETDASADHIATWTHWNTIANIYILLYDGQKNVIENGRLTH